MIPIRDSIPCHTKPLVTWSIMAVCAFVFIFFQMLPDELQRQVLYQYGMVPIRYGYPQWAKGFGLPPDNHLSFLTSLFLHGSWVHLISNLIFLWIFADNVEDLMGHKRFLAFYLICGFLATYVQWYSNPRSVVPVVGASGAIAAVLGAYFFRFPYARVVIVVPILFIPLFFEIPAVAFLGLWVILQLHDVTTAALFQNTPITEAWWAHLGGFLAGALLHTAFLKGKQPPVDDDRSEISEQ